MRRMGYLIRRNGWYSVRIVVPEHLQRAVGQVELVKSLKTDDLVTANKKAIPVIALFQQIIEQAQRDPQAAMVRQLTGGL
jgi:hypothetical protein